MQDAEQMFRLRSGPKGVVISTVSVFAKVKVIQTTEFSSGNEASLARRSE